jgi:hypothetical protein
MKSKLGTVLAAAGCVLAVSPAIAISVTSHPGASVMGPLMSTVPRSSRRRAHASVRGRRRGRHTMLSEGAVSLSRYAWFVG